MPHMFGNCAWTSCQFCTMQFLNCTTEQIEEHLAECARRKQQEMHPEVLDLDRDEEQENTIFPPDKESS